MPPVARCATCGSAAPVGHTGPTLQSETAGASRQLNRIVPKSPPRTRFEGGQGVRLTCAKNPVQTARESSWHALAESGFLLFAEGCGLTADDPINGQASKSVLHFDLC